MISPIHYALLSLVCAGVNDVVFKRYSSQDRSRGMYVFGIGLVWTVLQLTLLGISGDPLNLTPVSLTYGLVAGLLLTISNFNHIAIVDSIQLKLIKSCQHLWPHMGQNQPLAVQPTSLLQQRKIIEV